MTKNEMGAECGMHGRAMKVAYRVLMGKPKGKRLLGRRTCQWEDITLNVTKIVWDGTHLAQDRAKWWGLLMHNEPSCSIKYG
jgi:hypothetical protein